MILFISSLGERVLTHFSGKKESLLQVKVFWVISKLPSSDCFFLLQPRDFKPIHKETQLLEILERCKIRHFLTLNTWQSFPPSSLLLAIWYLFSYLLTSLVSLVSGLLPFSPTDKVQTPEIMKTSLTSPQIGQQLPHRPSSPASAGSLHAHWYAEPSRQGCNA